MNNHRVNNYKYCDFKVFLWVSRDRFLIVSFKAPILKREKIVILQLKVCAQMHNSDLMEFLSFDCLEIILFSDLLHLYFETKWVSQQQLLDDKMYYFILNINDKKFSEWPNFGWCYYTWDPWRRQIRLYSEYINL